MNFAPNAETSIIGEKRTSRVGLAHDLLSHSWDFDQGKENRFALDLPQGTLELAEVDAVNVENIVRGITGDKKKTSYGGVPIPPDRLVDPRTKEKKKK